MPPKAPPKIYQLLLRSHKTTIFLTRTPTSTVQEIKEEAQSAISSDVVSSKDLPETSFEICKVVTRGGSPEYQILDDAKQIKDCGVANWDVLYMRFRDPDTDELRDVEYTPLPSFDDEAPQEPETSAKGKRKASEIEASDLYA